MASPLTPEAVLAAVEAVMSRPFEWGPCDCCSAACDVFARLHGVDPIADLRPQYAGLRGAASLIQESGGLPALAASVAARLQLTAGHASGGLALSVDGRSMLVCIHPGQWAGKTQNGFGIVAQAGTGWYRA